MQKHADYLGIMGLLPFLCLPTFVLLQQISLFEAQGIFCYYAAVILSFFGGIHWYDALNRSKSVFQIYFAMLPSIIAWMAISFSYGVFTMAVLAVSFGGILLYDFMLLHMTPAYQRLRIILTGIVTGCHLFMIWLSI